MRTKLSFNLAYFMAAAFLASGAEAQDTGGYYAKVYGGLSSLQGDNLTLEGTTTSLSFDGGTGFGGAIGYDYADSPFRAELEYAYRSDDASDLAPAVGANGDFASTSIMLNGYYLFDTPTNLKPYAGLGVGYVTEIDFDVEGGPAAGEYTDRSLFAYQAILGTEYAASDRFSVYGEVRYFSAGTADLSGPGGAQLSADYDALDFVAGVTLKF